MLIHLEVAPGQSRKQFTRRTDINGESQSYTQYHVTGDKSPAHIDRLAISIEQCAPAA